MRKVQIKSLLTRQGIILGLLFLGFGVPVYAQSSGSFIKLEAEQGAISGQASLQNDTSASGGSYLAFNSGSSGVQFTETFETDQRNRFDWKLGTSQDPPFGTFEGEHDMNVPCGPPTTHRTVHQLPLQSGVPHSNIDITNEEFIWWCAPGSDSAKGHMMTALDTHAIATVSFSPKQVMNNVKKVCWDQNMTNLGEGKWLNVFIVQNSDVVSNNGDLAYAAGSGLPFGGIPQMLPPGAVDFTWLRGTIFSHKIQPDGSYSEGFNVWMSLDPTDTNGNGRIDPGDTPTRGMATDPAPRFTICVDDAGNQVTIERPNGTTDTYTYNVAFPTGQARVIFQDASYNPLKHGTPQGLTWHWDNIIIE